MEDHPDYPIQVHFDNSFAFIDKHREEGKNVLVQCHAGLSRSATLVCAYIMKKKFLSAETALQIVK